MVTRLRPLVSVLFLLSLGGLLASVPACDPVPGAGPPPATPDSEQTSTTESSGSTAESSATVSMTAPNAISPPFVPVAASGGSRVSCPTRVPRREPVAYPQVPTGWVTLPGAPDAQTLKCGNLSRREWIVRRGARDVEISLAQRRPVDDPLPFALTGKAREGLGGTRKVKPVDNGFLVGFDAGEHGGALWWMGTSGQRRLRLVEENVIGFADLGGVPVAVTGFSHQGISRGKVIRLAVDGAAEAWRVAAWVDLGAASQTFASESPDTMLVLTTSGLVRITACGDMSLLAPARYDVLYPTSMAVDDAGVVTIGMRHFTTRWVPSASGYREEWLVRADCARSSVKKFECVCGG